MCKCSGETLSHLEPDFDDVKRGDDTARKTAGDGSGRCLYQWPGICGATCTSSQFNETISIEYYNKISYFLSF